MPLTYDITNNIITIVGYTEGSPCGFVDLWNADKAGTLSLHARTGITNVDANPVNLTRNARPADEVLLGGPKNDLYITVSNWANMTSASIRLVGTDANGGAQTEDLAVTGNGTYNATKLFKTLTQSQVTAFVKIDSGSFSYEVSQGQWGVVWKTGSSQFRFDCKIVVGNGSTATWFADTLKQVVFSAGLSPMIKIVDNAICRFGALYDVNNKISADGCSFISLGTGTLDSIIFGDWGTTTATCYLYSCFLAAGQGRSYVRNVPVGRCYNTVFAGRCAPFECGFDFYNVFVLNSYFGFLGAHSNGAATFNHIVVENCTIALYNAIAKQTMKDVTCVNSTKLFEQWLLGANVYLINVVSDVWVFQWDQNGTIYRQYEFDLKVTDKDGNNISGATATLKDKDGNQVFSVNTDVNGNIATQTVSRGYYDQSHGNTLQDYGPHTLTITKTGYQTHAKKFTLTAKTVWEVKLAKAQHILLNSGRPVLNLKLSDPENKNVMVL